MVAVRVNPLAGDGMEDLAAVMRGAPDIVALPKVSEPEHVIELDEAVTRFEEEYDIPPAAPGSCPISNMPADWCADRRHRAGKSPRTVACLLASEDLAADLGAERGRDGLELVYCRQRFLVECVASGIVAVDCPYTWQDLEGVERDALWARRLGYQAKSAVVHEHARVINPDIHPLT